MSQADRHGEALLGIHLAQTGGQVKGSPPSDEELALLMDGVLDDERRAEVLSHLAHRPERYRQWLNLAAMDDAEHAAQAGLLQVLAKGINNWLVDWRYAAGGLGAFAAVLLLVNQMALQPTEETAIGALPAAEDALMLRDAPPSAPAPEAQRRARLEAEQQRRETLTLEQSREPQARASAKLAMPAVIAERCIALPHPETAAPGTLCALGFDNDRQNLQWLAGSGERRNLAQLPSRPLQLRASENRQWIALQTVSTIYVQSAAALFAGDSEPKTLPFTAATARLHWEGNELVISVLQALGDSDDDLQYRYLPEAGELRLPRE